MNQKQTALNESQLTFVDQFVALMNKKSDIQVNVCPIASTSELDETAGKETISKEQKQRLVEIAKERGDEFKREVVALTDKIGTPQICESRGIREQRCVKD